jgi:hypothetical protein
MAVVILWPELHSFARAHYGTAPEQTSPVTMEKRRRKCKRVQTTPPEAENFLPPFSTFEASHAFPQVPLHVAPDQTITYRPSAIDYFAICHLLSAIGH